MDLLKSNVIVDIAKTASLLSKQLLDLNSYIKSNPDKLKLFNYATPSSSGYNSTKTSNEHLDQSNTDEAYYSTKKGLSSLSSSSCSYDASMNMSCASANSSVISSSSSMASCKRINKRLFVDLDPMADRQSIFAAGKFSTPQHVQNKAEPKLPRIKETRKEKLKFRLKLMKQFAKHRNHLKSFIKSEKSKEDVKSQQLVASTPFRTH